jgi:flagellar biosynthesis anti-sigma factor FlgM
MNIPSSFNPSQPVGEAQAPARTTANPAAAEPTKATTAVSADEDTASISPAGAAAAAGFSDVRLEKVTAIQQALANGSYAVSAEDVASKLIDHMLSKD